MSGYLDKRFTWQRQCVVSIILVLVASLICYAVSSYIGYRVVAFILLLTVSLNAMLFGIWPVLLSAVVSAFIWDFFFIPPRFNFHVGATEDKILLLMYFVIASINGVLTFKIRQVEKLARKKEEKANAVKLYDTILNSLSHELRTPIATIIAATDNLQTGNKNLTDENKGKLIGEIAKASLRLNQQVENLLNMSRLDSGFIKPKLDWCDITDTIHGVVKKIEDNKITQRIKIDINPNIPLVKTDKGLVEEILTNLLSNATHYTPAGSTIHISALIYADILQLVIEDNGHGFPEEEIDDVFDKFYRLKNTKAGGTGLGLSIVKGFTEALKGNVRLENVSPTGARFIVDIPCQISTLNM